MGREERRAQQDAELAKIQTEIPRLLDRARRAGADVPNQVPQAVIGRGKGAAALPGKSDGDPHRIRIPRRHLKQRPTQFGWSLAHELAHSAHGHPDVGRSPPVRLWLELAVALVFVAAGASLAISALFSGGQAQPPVHAWLLLGIGALVALAICIEVNTDGRRREFEADAWAARFLDEPVTEAVVRHLHTIEPTIMRVLYLTPVAWIVDHPSPRRRQHATRQWDPCHGE